MNKLSSWKTIFFSCVFCASTPITSPAQTGCSVAAPCFTTLVSFNGTDGDIPNGYPGSLVQGRDGNFYGTTWIGGAHGAGTIFVFKVNSTGTGGTLTTLYSFCAKTACTDGSAPVAGLVLGTDGNFYGTTESGGTSSNSGTVFVFKVNSTGTGGTLTTLHSFDVTDGAYPTAGLVQATDGNFYGTTDVGGAHNSCSGVGTVGCGTVFKITSGGALTTLFSFDGTDGFTPYGTLVQATNGSFYGTTYAGGAKNDGTVFKLSPKPSGGCPSGSNTGNGWCETVFYSFCSKTSCNDDGGPYAELVQATDGNFYGTTPGEGNNQCTLGCGTIFVFKVNSTGTGGTLTTLHSFDVTDGAYSFAELVQATDGNFYGTTEEGSNNGCSFASYGCGTIFVFKVNSTGTGGTLTTLHSFDVTDGLEPIGGLLQATNGKFYGTTNRGGDLTCDSPYGCGTVFSLSVGLGPFVEAVTYSGKVGTIIEFLGQGFTTTSAVSFNGKAASRTVVSGTYLTATVPNGAITGFVTVTTSGGTLKSNKIFRVIPQITSFSPTSGPVGTVVTINGESFQASPTGATTVTFGGGVKGTITSVSYTKITAQVPSGAKTGKITVTTPGGTATSSGTFTVN